MDTQYYPKKAWLVGVAWGGRRTEDVHGPPQLEEHHAAAPRLQERALQVGQL